jgi:broad specificity phosphatase PhoE
VSEESISITFVRHGQSLANQAQRWQGQGDSPLSELGKQQAALLGARLSPRRFTHIFSSDLTRAADTARAIGLPFELDPMLREFDVGAWEGLTREEVAERYPDEIERLKEGEDIPLGGGESYARFAVRVDAALATLRARLAPGDHALVVCHGGVIATALAGVLGLRKTRNWALARVGNTSVTALSFLRSRARGRASTSRAGAEVGAPGDGARLEVFNDTLHLLPLGGWPLLTDLRGVIGLICEAFEGECFGAFDARYDTDEPPPAPQREASRDALVQALSERLSQLHQLHPEQRVALAARAGSIHAWAEQVLWHGPALAGALAPPRAGSISHVGRLGDRVLLLDYGVGL